MFWLAISIILHLSTYCLTERVLQPILFSAGYFQIQLISPETLPYDISNFHLVLINTNPDRKATLGYGSYFR